MKAEEYAHLSAHPHRRYPSLSHHFDRECEPSKANLLSSGTSRPDALFRLYYLRVIAVLATLMIIAALVANA